MLAQISEKMVELHRGDWRQAISDLDTWIRGKIKEAPQEKSMWAAATHAYIARLKLAAEGVDD